MTGNVATSAQETRIDCADDPIGGIKAMFVDQVQAERIAKGQCPARRPVFLQQHGGCRGIFAVRDDLPDDLKVGLFAGRHYDAWVRFSCDTPGESDWKQTVGIGIKLFDVPGARLLDIGGGPEGNSAAPGTFDVLLQNMDVFFVDTATDFCTFTQMSLAGTGDDYIADHPDTARILTAMEKPVGSVLGTPYWSALPFAFGPDRFVKYKLEPVAEIPADPTRPLDPRALRRDLIARMAAGEARFRFLVQFQTDPAAMPLDRATVPWGSPVVHVADLILPAQSVDARNQDAYVENLAFNSWRVSEPHRPQGSIAAARRVTYAASAEQRRDVNGVPDGEPAQPRPLIAPPPAVDRVIVGAAIHPAIGVARIGNSDDGFFIGPETVTPAGHDAGFYRDETGALKRQAARFRVYGHNAAGEVVAELTANNAMVEWTVHVANRKAEWYRFIAALDIPDAVNLQTKLRNAKVPVAQRGTLAIDPGPRSIAGHSEGGDAAHRFDTGTFKGTKVDLGEVRTDEQGRLLFLGGKGVSGSPGNSPLYDPGDPDSYNNANDWYDDTSDGPVTARVIVDGVELPVDSAWVIVAPPNYAPDFIAWRSMYDLQRGAFVEAGMTPFPDPVLFTRDILPQLQRLGELQWLNKGFAAMFGIGGAIDFADPALIERLATPPTASGADPWVELRRTLYNGFRPETLTGDAPGQWPWLYGDAEGSFSETSPRNNLALPRFQAALMRQWVRGAFVDDRSSATPTADIAALPVADQPAMLDRAAMSYCLADAFHPGCEITWPMRHASMYLAPFRLRHRPAGQPERFYGPVLTQPIVLGPDGPLGAQGPGTLTRYMALPWQGDTATCRSGYDADYDPYLSSFWPARVPNQVLDQADYAIVMDVTRSRADRLAAFQTRVDWEFSTLGQLNYPAIAEAMIREFDRMGIVEKRPGPVGDPLIPEIIYVSTSLPKPELLRAALAPIEDGEEAPAVGRVAEAGWRSEEQRQSFEFVRYRNRR